MMTKAELLDLISRFSNRPVPALTSGRHVYLWHGQLEVLFKAIPNEVSVSRVDLHRLAIDLPRTPRATTEARKLLRHTIQKTLNTQLTANGQQIFVVTGCDLLSRYQVSLNPFFELASEKRMIIFVVVSAETRFQPPPSLPSYVELNTSVPFEYLQTTVGSVATISVEEDN